MTYINFRATIRLIAPSDLCRSRRHPGSGRNVLEAAGVIVVVGTATVNSARRHLPLPISLFTERGATTMLLRSREP